MRERAIEVQAECNLRMQLARMELMVKLLASSVAPGNLNAMLELLPESWSAGGSSSGGSSASSNSSSTDGLGFINDPPSDPAVDPK